MMALNLALIEMKMASNTVSEQIQKLLGIIESNPEATQAPYAAELGISKRTISRMLASLQEQGVLEQKGTKRKATSQKSIFKKRGNMILYKHDK